MTSYEKYLMSLDEKKYLIDNNISLERTRETTLHLREDSRHFHKNETNSSNYYKALGCLPTRSKVSIKQA